MGLYGSYNRQSGLRGLGAFGQGDQATLYAGQQLTPNTSIKSDNGVFTFGMGGDGNLWVTDNVRNIVLRNFNIAGRGAVKAIMQGDGNFVVYNSSGGAIWNSGPKGGGAYLVMQGDGNLVIYLNGVAKWQTGTSQPASTVASDVYAALTAPNRPITVANMAFWNNLQRTGQISSADNILLKSAQAAEATAVFSGGITFVSAGTPVPTAAQQEAANTSLATKANLLMSGVPIEELINQLMIQKDHNGTLMAQYWKVPQFLNATGNGWLSPQDTKTKIYASIDAYIAKINSSDLSSLTIADKKYILYYLMYPYFYFANQTINLSPYHQTGHSGHQIWPAAQWSSDYTYDILGKIIPIVQKLGFTGMYSYLTGLVVTFWGASYGATNTGGNYPTQIGFRKLIDETYRSQADAAAKNSSVIGQVGEFFNQLGTEAWHGLVMPAIGFSALGIMLTGFQGVTFIIEIFDPKLHLNALIYGWIGHMFQGFPLLGQFINSLLQWYGKWLDHVALQITNIFSPNVDPNKARDEEEYKILTSSTDNELINFEKNVQAITKILNDWDSDQRDDLKAGLITNINNRANSKVIWASLNVIDSKLLGVA